MRSEMQQIKLFHEAYEMYKNGEYSTAFQLFRKVIEMYGKDAAHQTIDSLYLSYFGVCLAIVKKDLKNGEKLCKKALRYDKSNFEVYLNLGRVYEEMQVFHKAADVYRKGHRAFPGNQILLSNLERVSPRGCDIIPFLSRNSYANKYLGKLFRRSKTIKNS